MLQNAEWADTPKFGYHGSILTHEAWLEQQAKYKFAISPLGNGIDCHRTWEMMLVGVIPILRTSIIDSVFDKERMEGAVLIVQEWEDLNRTMLETHWRRYGERLLQRRKNWMVDQGNVMLATHWIHRFSLHSSNDLRMAEATLPEDVKKEWVNQIGFATYGNDAYAAAKQRIVNEAKDTGWFGLGVKDWGPEDLSVDFQQKYKQLLELPRGGGYWIWKFHVIEQTMATMEEGQFLVYLDAGSRLNEHGEQRFFEYIQMLNQSQYDLLGFQLPFLEHKWTTPRIFDAFNVSGNPSITHSGQLEGGTMLIRKGSHYRKWIALCRSVIDTDSWMLTDKYNEEARLSNPEFRENRHDQSVMSVARKLLGYVRVDGRETKKAYPDLPFHVLRKKDGR